MPLPIVTDCYQATFVWVASFAPRPATTTLHFHDRLGTQTAANLYADINTNVTASMFAMLNNTAAVETVNVTKLDGTSAGQAFSTGRPAKWSGGTPTETILQGAIVVSLKSAQRGPRGRNRIFLPWVAEDEQTNGTLAAGPVSALQGAWQGFSSAMNTLDWDLAAVSGKYSDWHAVNSIVVRPYLKTQRRRARR